MILKNWHFQDPPDSWEIARNDFIDSLQNNRNPFIDSIDYVCFVNFSNIGNKNARVLPVPVGAIAKISCPSSATGIAFSCISVGVV